MANCVLCTEFDNCPWRSDPDAICSVFKQKPMSNGDRIRGMTDEELVKIILCPMTTPCIHLEDDYPCANCKLEWLKEEVSE